MPGGIVRSLIAEEFSDHQYIISTFLKTIGFYIIFFILLAIPFVGVAQESPSRVGDTVGLSLRDVYPAQGISYRFIDDTLALEEYLSTLQVSNPAKEDTCALYMNQLQRMQRSMLRIATPRNGKMWTDSITYITDFDYYRERVIAVTAKMQRQMLYYRTLEQQRIEEERRIAREKARQAQALIDKQAVESVQTIQQQHDQIENICMGHGVTDKALIKDLKDLRYSYLPIYNQYNLSSNNATQKSVAKLDELRLFQRQLLDSVLLPGSIPEQIERFPGWLRERAGKDHLDIYRSYLKVMRTPRVPITFNSLEGYHQYIAQMQIITTVQRYYYHAVELADQIASGNALIQSRCSKRHKEIYDSYRSVLGQTNTVPAYSTIAEAQHFETTILEHLSVQQAYLDAIDRIDRILSRGDSIVNVVPRHSADVAAAYRLLQSSTHMTPDFRTLKGALFFGRQLDDFETLQRYYLDVIDLRTAIYLKSDSIVTAKSSPKGFVNAYKILRGQRTFQPSFRSQAEADKYIEMLYQFIDLQNLFLQSLHAHNTIGLNGAQIREYCNSTYANIAKAYNKLYRSYNLEATFYTDHDLQHYLDVQDRLLYYQQCILRLLQSPSEAIRADQMLKGEKDIDRIKLAFTAQ